MKKDDLKEMLKPRLIALYEKSRTGDGIADEDYADELADIIAGVIPYIQDTAAVPVGDLWAAGPYPVEGGPTKVQ
ncbi:MAG: hypothetical protein LBK83_07630 [Treponema sp.]|nr:hypothetical protein [Treponema sp.]